LLRRGAHVDNLEGYWGRSRLGLWYKREILVRPRLQHDLGETRCSANYGVRPSGTYTFQDQLGLVRGTKSKIEDGYATGTLPLRGVAVGDLAGAQRLRLQLVLEFRNFSLLSAAPFHHVVGPSATLVYCLTLSSTGFEPLKRIAQNYDAHTLLACRTMPRAR